MLSFKQTDMYSACTHRKVKQRETRIHTQTIT